MNTYGSSVMQRGMACSISVVNYLSDTAETITSNGIAMSGSGGVWANGSGSWTLQDTFKTNGSIVSDFTLQQGTLNTEAAPKPGSEWPFPIVVSALVVD
ncbi:hypothetical protein [Taibaiella koreensis]|uniref:hypothetical protein n=1 Tax=Taibaiella koreensis TaxID=1268548 RepID=UPI0013C30E39|nr:hypothetical protein [Taibaiella koreensis]